MSEWFETEKVLFQKALGTLELGVKSARHPARFVSFSTVSPEGWPEARTVAIRRFDRVEMVVDVHTDLRSSKIESLAATPKAALNWWFPDMDMQVRLQAEVSIASGEKIASEWAKVPAGSRVSYGRTPPPGAPIKDALAYVKEPNPADFAILRCQILTMDLVHLGRDHRRISFTRPRDWRGEWLSP